MKSWPPILDNADKRRAALEFLPLVLVPVAFLAISPWLKMIGGPMVSLVSAAAAIFVMGYANFYAFRRQRGLDEVQKASAGVAAQWGMPVGQAAFVLLLMLPPFIDFTTAVVTKFAGDPGTIVDRSVVVFAMTLGFCGVVLLQGIGMLVVNVIWWKSKQ